jgi:mono/diheme cytochrome c family protein
LLAAPASAQPKKPTGAEVWAANCARCHRLRAIDAYNASQWDAIVTHMALNARFTPDETEAVRQFLVDGAKARQSTASASQRVAPAPDVKYLAYLGVGISSPSAVSAGGSACGSPPGKDIYTAYCAMCHGAKGKGDGPAAAGLNPRPANLSDSARMARLSEDSLTKVVTTGRKAMPAFGAVLKFEELREVLTHVRCLSNTPGTK